MKISLEQQMANINDEMAAIKERILGNSDAEETRQALKQLSDLAKRIVALNLESAANGSKTT